MITTVLRKSVLEIGGGTLETVEAGLEGLLRAAETDDCECLEAVFDDVLAIGVDVASPATGDRCEASEDAAEAISRRGVP